MSSRAQTKQNLGRKAWLAMAALTTIVLPISAIAQAARVQGTPSSPVNPSPSQTRLVFEVASVKENVKAASFSGSVRILPGGGLNATEAPLRRLIMSAYGLVQRYQVAGGPNWIDVNRFDIDARAEATSSATTAQVRLMLRSLLEDRFKLRLHSETRELPVYELVVAKSGLKLSEPKEGSCFTPAPTASGAPPIPPPPPPPPPPSSPGQPSQPMPPMIPPCGNAAVGISPAGARIDGGKVTMASFINTLSSLLGRPVIDKTAYSGTFDAHLEFTPDQALAGLPPGGPPPRADLGVSIFTAIEEQLGLKLESAKGPVDVLVVDSAEKPTEN